MKIVRKWRLGMKRLKVQVIRYYRLRSCRNTLSDRFMDCVNCAQMHKCMKFLKRFKGVV